MAAPRSKLLEALGFPSIYKTHIEPLQVVLTMAHILKVLQRDLQRRAPKNWYHRSTEYFCHNGILYRILCPCFMWPCYPSHGEELKFGEPRRFQAWILEPNTPPKSGLKYSYSVDYRTLRWIYFLDPPQKSAWNFVGAASGALVMASALYGRFL